MKKLFTRLATAAVMLAPMPAALAGNTIEDHNRLWTAVEEAGVTVIVNHPKHCDDSWGGGFYAQDTENLRSYLVVCQDEGKGAGLDNHVEWSANDLDTLRHEAHHLLQDCLAGVRGDGELTPLMEGADHKEFVTRALTSDRIKWIIESYTENGADRDVLMLELEAFAVAEDVDASQIADGVDKACAVTSPWRF